MFRAAVDRHGELLTPPNVKTDVAWKTAFDLGSTIERARKSLKHAGFIALSDPAERPCHGQDASARRVAE
jgi:hypothetical protein